MTNINLNNNRAFSWQQSGKVWAKGYLYSSGGRYYSGIDLPEYFVDVDSEIAFAEKVRAANGGFCVIVQVGDVYYVAVDRLRSMLMFVAKHNGQILIGDDANVLRDKLELDSSDLDALKVEELRQSGYTVGSHTIYKSIAQLRGGEYAVVTDDEYAIHYYYEHTHGNFMDISKTETFQQLDGISERMFRRLIDSVDGRQIVVPLSGGYDSRYIVAWLKKIGYENVCCFTYGRKTSFEVQISRQVAEKLAYEWHFVEYTDKTWQSILAEEWRPFYEYSGQLSQLPHVQDIYAIRKLLEQGIIHKDAVVVPGYCGDGLGGSYYTSAEDIEELSVNGLAQAICKKHFSFLKSNYLRKDIENDIKASFNNQIVTSVDEYNSISEAWFTINRWSKFVVNALRGYDYFGLEWRMPLWDNELMEFWYRVPNKHRGMITWYDEYLLTGVFKEYGIDIIKKNVIVKNKKISNIVYNCKKYAKKIMPLTIIDKIKHAMFSGGLDVNQAGSLIDLVRAENTQLKDIEDIVDSRCVNAFLTLRYLHVILGII